MFLFLFFYSLFPFFSLTKKKKKKKKKKKTIAEIHPGEMDPLLLRGKGKEKEGGVGGGEGGGEGGGVKLEEILKVTNKV